MTTCQLFRNPISGVMPWGAGWHTTLRHFEFSSFSTTSTQWAAPTCMLLSLPCSMASVTAWANKLWKPLPPKLARNLLANFWALHNNPNPPDEPPRGGLVQGSPKGGAGAGVGIGMWWRGGNPLIESTKLYQGDPNQVLKFRRFWFFFPVFLMVF